ncbi:MAG: hypothetical protein K9G30_00950 [Parvibaculum sp.]|nr:hypothetical protein [Parvibaculum sp.]
MNNPYAKSATNILSLVGQATMNWNEIDQIWYLIFTCLMHETPRDKTDAIFSQFLTAKAQRELILTVAAHALKKHPRYKTRIGQLAAKTNDLSGIRNAIVHGAYRFDPLNGPPYVRISPKTVASKKANRLAGKDLEREITAHIVDVQSFIADLDEFRMELIEKYIPKSKPDNCQPKA